MCVQEAGGSLSKFLANLCPRLFPFPVNFQKLGALPVREVSAVAHRLEASVCLPCLPDDGGEGGNSFIYGLLLVLASSQWSQGTEFSVTRQSRKESFPQAS